MLNLIKFSAFVIVFFTFSGTVNGQTFGFNGKKNTLSLFSTGGIRVFPLAAGFAGVGSASSTLQSVHYNSSNQMKERINIVRCDFRLTYSRLLNKNFGLGAEFGYERFALPMMTFDDLGFINSQSTPVFNVFSGMIVFEFYPDKGTAPIGFSSSLGIGPKIYSFDLSENYRFDKSTPMDKPYPIGASDLLSINFFYQMNYKKVLNSFITFDVGMRFHTGILLPAENGFNSNTEYRPKQLRSELFAHNLASLVSLRMGFSFLL